MIFWVPLKIQIPSSNAVTKRPLHLRSLPLARVMVGLGTIHQLKLCFSVSCAAVVFFVLFMKVRLQLFVEKWLRES